MFKPQILQLITGILLLLGAVVAGAAGAPLYAIPIIACLFVLVEIARGKYTFKTSGESIELIKMILGFVFIFFIQCLIAWGLISLGGFLAKLITGDTLSFSWLVGLGVVALFAVLPFFVPSLKRQALMESIFTPVMEEKENQERQHIESTVLGRLVQHHQFDDWWESDNIYIPCLEKEAPVTFIDCVDEDIEAYTQEADSHLQVFLQMSKEDLRKFTPDVKANLEMNVDATDYGEELPFMNLKNDEDVWSYIEASKIYMKEADGDVILSVPFNCDWEDEHGFRLDFKDGIELIYAGQDY